MPLYKTHPVPSGRMGLLWTLGLIKDAAVLEFGCMGHMLYAEKWLSQTGVPAKSKLFSTHIDEKDIALGITKRFENAVEEILHSEDIKALFILPSSVPEMIGIDMDAICEPLQENHKNIPIITLGAGNFKADKYEGIEEALYQLVQNFPSPLIKSEEKEKYRKGKQYNILGSISDMKRFYSNGREIIRIMEGAFGMKIVCHLTGDVSVDDLQHIHEADVNLVIRKEGLKAAKDLEEKYGIPYLYGTPYGLQGTINWIHSLEKLLGQRAEDAFINREIWEISPSVHLCKMYTGYKKDKAQIWVEDENEKFEGLLEFACKEIGFKVGHGGIFMGNAPSENQKPPRTTIALIRTTKSVDVNLYASPYMGFRGAMKLCSLWIHYLNNES